MNTEFGVRDITEKAVMHRVRYMHWDIEISILVTTMDVRMTHIELIDITNRAWYRVPWSQDLKTARDIVEHYRPDLVEQYDKAHPNGEYNPYIDYSDESGQ